LRLLNILERHLSVSHELPIASALLTAKLLQDTVEVAAKDGDVGVVGAEGSLGDLQGALVVGAGTGQVPRSVSTVPRLFCGSATPLSLDQRQTMARICSTCWRAVQSYMPVPNGTKGTAASARLAAAHSCSSYPLMITTGTVFGNPGGGAANVQVVPAAVPALMMPGAPLNGTRTTVFVPTTCSASVCAGPVLARVTVPSPVQVASNKAAWGLLTGSAPAPVTGNRAAAAATATTKENLFTLSSLFMLHLL
jgi:hypothetical protein